MCEAKHTASSVRGLARKWASHSISPKRHEGWELQEVCLKDGELASDERNRVEPIGFHSSVVAGQI